MNFWKNHKALRFILMAVFFVVGIALTYIGWTMTGKLLGLGIMIVGISFLLATMFVYNAAYK